MKYNKEDIVSAHDHSIYNRKKLNEDNVCGCFCCLEIFSPDKIEEWCNDEQTAVCPFCGIDSIISESSVIR